MPRKFRGAILANEVLDAMPVERFVRRDTIQQLRVTFDDGRFEFVEAAAPDILVNAVNAIERDLGASLGDAYRSEVSLGLAPWIGDLLGRSSTGWCCCSTMGYLVSSTTQTSEAMAGCAVIFATTLTTIR